MARTIVQQGPERANRIIFIGAIGLAALAAVLVFVALSNSRGGSNEKTSSSPTDVTVVIASRDINAGTKITEDMLGTASVSRAAAVSNFFTDRSSLIGLTTLYPLSKSQQFSSANVLGAGTKGKAGFAYVVPEGKRAVALQVDEKTAVGGLIVAGDRVDVIAVAKLDKQPGQTDADDRQAARMLLQDIEVLSVAQTSQTPISRVDKDGKPIASDSAEGVLATRPENTDAKPEARTVTLALDPKDTPLLALAQDQGRVYLSLRSPTDREKVDSPIVIGLPTR